jgi:CheY-like chemotaxis protein
MSKRILVVEDQPDSRRIIRDMLAPTDFEIIEAENGEEALAAIAKQRPDLILMDIQLPIMDGYRHAPDQSRSRAAINPYHRCHLVCARWRRKDREGRGL